jgi:hypothetical protein
MVARRSIAPGGPTRTDDEDAQWFDAKLLCHTVLGYGIDYGVADGEVRAVDPRNELRD